MSTVIKIRNDTDYLKQPSQQNTQRTSRLTKTRANTKNNDIIYTVSPHDYVSVYSILPDTMEEKLASFMKQRASNINSINLWQMKMKHRLVSKFLISLSTVRKLITMIFSSEQISTNGNFHQGPLTKKHR